MTKFGSMSSTLHRQASSKGGSAKVKKGAAMMTPEQRREAGRKGGLATKAKREAERLRQEAHDRKIERFLAKSGGLDDFGLSYESIPFRVEKPGFLSKILRRK